MKSSRQPGVCASIVFLALLALSTLGAADESLPQAAQEYRLKAAFLYNFTKFVEWPPAAFADPRAPFVLCLLGEDRFGSALDALAGRQVQGRPLEIRRITLEAQVRNCQMLYLGVSDADTVAAVLTVARSLPLLTVSDRPGFAERGGAMELALVDQRIALRINPAAAGRAQLKLSAQLLRLAQLVDDVP